LQIKDRHNGNILLHKEGYIVHIDFGFLLSSAPKGNLEKEVPFKMTEEYVEILGGYDSNLFKRFRRMFFEGFKMIRKHKNKVLLLVKTMRGADLKCFKENTLWELEDRFLAEDLSDT
jgi:phosphatidylinositol 4-kinase